MATTTDPNQSYYAQIQTDLASSNPQTALAGALGASTAPTVAGQQLSVASTEQQLGDLGPQLQQQADYSSLMAGYQLGGLGIGAQQNDLSKQGSQQGFANTQLQQGIQGQQQALNYQNQMQSLVGGAAASGALNTEGAKQSQATASKQYGWGQEELKSQEALSAGDFARAQQNFDLMAKANGISQQEVYSRLQYGLSQMGQSADPSSLAAQAGNAMSGSVQGVGSTLSQAGLLGGMNALSGLG